MDQSSGFGTNGIPFEYTVAEQKTKVLILKKLSLIAIYVLWAAGWLLFGFSMALIVPFLALVPLSLWVLVFLTWRLTQVEYEYSYFAGVLTVCRIRGSRSRKKLAEITIRDISAIIPCDEEHVDQINTFGVNKTIFAASGVSSPNLWVALWKDELDNHVALYFEPNEKALKILKYYNSSALSKSFKRCSAD